MAQVIPQYEVKTRKTTPSWIDTKSIIEAGKGGKRDLIVKQASKKELIVVSYFCTPCNKVFQSSHQDFIKQATLASKAGKEFSPVCPKCGSEVLPYRETSRITQVSNLQSISQEKRVDLLDKTAGAKGTYNTFVDRRLVYGAIEKLSRYASKLGMTGCTVRYLKSEHVKEAGNDLSTLNNLECSLEWMYGRRQKGRATAVVRVDTAGNFEFPKVFKVSSGMEYPFEEKFVRQLEREPSLFQSLPQRKKSDIPTFRKPDPTRFRVASKKIKDFKKK